MEPALSSRWSYRNYCSGITPKASRIVLFALVLTALAAEVSLRLTPPTYTRNARNSGRGIRVLLTNMLDDPRPKIIGIGDSSLLGSGVPSERDTSMGMIRQEVGRGVGVYNLAFPGGNSFSNAMVLRGLQRVKPSNVQLLILEVLPSRFLVREGENHEVVSAASTELPKYFPDADWPGPRPIMAVPSLPSAVEAFAEYDLARWSMLYRQHDYFRVKIVGDNPAFWLAAEVLPQGLQANLTGRRKTENNRVSAQADEGQFLSGEAKASDALVRFSPTGEAEAFPISLDEAAKFAPGRVLVLIHPIHIDYFKLTPRARKSTLDALHELHRYLLQQLEIRHIPWVEIDSRDVQDDRYWTWTPAHFTAKLHKKVFERINPIVKTFTSLKGNAQK